MEPRSLGDSDLVVSPIGLGTWAIDELLDDDSILID